MPRKLWELIRHRHWVVAGFWFATYIIAAVALPNTDHRMLPLSVPLRLTMLAVGVSTLVFAVSLSFYFFDSWSRSRTVATSVMYKVWISFETVLGVPFTLICFAFAGVCFWVVAFR